MSDYHHPAVRGSRCPSTNIYFIFLKSSINGDVNIGADVFEIAILVSTGIPYVHFSAICCNTQHLNKSTHPSMSLFSVYELFPALL